MRISDWSSDVCSSDLLSLCYTNTALTNAASSSIALASRGDCSPTALPSAAAFGNALRRTIDVGSTPIPSMSPIISKAAYSSAPCASAPFGTATARTPSFLSRASPTSPPTRPTAPTPNPPGRPALGRRVRERLAPHYRRGQHPDPLNVADHFQGGLIVGPLRVRAVQHGDGAQALVDLARLGHQRRNLVKRPHVEAARLHRHQQRVSHGERGAQRAGITAAHVNDNIVIFGRELRSEEPTSAI